VKHLISFVAGIVITVIALVYALAKVDIARMLKQLSGADFRLLPPFLLLLALYFLVTAFNWIQLLRPLGRFRLGQVLPAMMIGFGGNNVLPAHLGELVRTVVFARQFQHSTGSVLASLVLERLMDVFSILIFYFVAVHTDAGLPESIRTGAQVVALAMVPFCLALILFLRVPAPFMRLWAWGSAWLPRRWSERGTRLLEGIVHGLSAVESPRRVALVLALALVKWALTGGMVWLALLAFHTSIVFSAAVIVVAVGALAVSLPSAPGYVGTLQAAFVFSLTPFGIPPEVAFAGSVYYLVAQWVPVTAAGVISFFLVGVHLKELRHDVEEAEKNPAGN
jgi:hypothetical protein